MHTTSRAPMTPVCRPRDSRGPRPRRGGGAARRSVADSSLISLVAMGHASPLALDEELQVEGRCLGTVPGWLAGHRHVGDGFLVEFACGKGTPDLTLVVDQDLVGQADQLGQ